MHGSSSVSQPTSALNESPSEKEGKYPHRHPAYWPGEEPLNESPSEKEGKSPSKR